jgi:GDP-4-dehydro-6-deoxy-D-mannose reductase
MTTILITGNCGFAGSHLEQHLRNTATNRTAVFGYDMRMRSVDDVRDYDRLRAVIEENEPDYVYHLAAQAYVAEGNSDPQRAYDVNVSGTLNLLEALRHTGCRARVLIAGTTEEYGYSGHSGRLTEDAPTRPTTVYGATKLAATHLAMVYARTYGMHIVVTRAGNHTGAGRPPVYADSAFAKRIALAEAGRLAEVTHGNLDAVRNYSDVRDVVAAYRLAIDCPPGIYNVTSNATVSMRDLLNILLSHATGPITTREDPALIRPGTAEFYPIPSDKLRTATGWEPKIPLTETLRSVLDYWRHRI